MIESLLFDLDDTILDFKAGERKALSETLQRLGIEPTEQILSQYHEINDSLWKALERGETTREKLIYDRFQRLFEEYGISACEKTAQNLYGELLGLQHEFIPGAQELLETLHTRYSLYLVSNGNESVQRSRLRLCGIEHYFRQIFISAHLGASKPNPLFFQKVFSLAPEIEPKHCAIIGDSLTSDIKGGIQAGIKTIWFHPSSEVVVSDIRPDYVVRSLSEIPTLLEII